MASGRVQVTFDCRNPDSLATFWAAVLEYPPPDMDDWNEILRAAGRDGDVGRWCRVEDPTGARPRLFFQRVPEPKTAKNRVHLDVAVAPATPEEQRAQIDAEVERVVGLGATVVRVVTDEDGYFVTLLDPEGNEFCID